MKNIKKRLIGWTLGLALSLGVGIGIASNAHSEITEIEAVGTGETSVAKLTFPDDNQANNKVGAYNKSWPAPAKKGTNSWEINNFNNNSWNNNWTYIKCGYSKQALVANIKNTTKIVGASKIVVTIGAVTASNVNSFFLECSNTSTGAAEKKIEKKIQKGEVVFDVGTAEFSYFNLNFDCKAVKACVQVNSVEYIKIDESVHSVSISGPKAVEKGKTVQLEASCSKTDLISWSCTPENVATVSSTGLVTGVSEGEATVTATCAGSGTATYKVKVFEIVKGKTISEVMNLPADATKLYEINGTVSQWHTNNGELNNDASQYGNYYLKDSSVSEGNGLLIYGATATADSLSYDGTKFVFNNPKDYLANELTKDTKIGSNVVMYGFRLDYKDKKGTTTKEFNGVVTSVTNSASDFATYFLDALSGACDASGNSNMETLKLGWATVALEFAKLSNVDKDVYSKGTGNSTGNNIEKAIALYDYIATKYGTSLESEDCTNYNFMNRSVTPVAGSKTILGSNGNASATALVTIVALASLTAVGGFFFIRKRKEQN